MYTIKKIGVSAAFQVDRTLNIAPPLYDRFLIIYVQLTRESQTSPP